jgi:hypothetical protein
LKIESQQFGILIGEILYEHLCEPLEIDHQLEKLHEKLIEVIESGLFVGLMMRQEEI